MFIYFEDCIVSDITNSKDPLEKQFLHKVY